MAVKGKSRQEAAATLAAALAGARQALDEASEDLDVVISEPLQGLTVVEGAMSKEAIEAFFTKATELLGDRKLSVEAARRAAVLAATEQVWEDEIGPLLSTADVRELLGDVSRQRVSGLLDEHRLVGLRDQGGRLRFPAFQFKDGRPIEALVAAFWTVAAEAETDWTAAAWCVAPDELLDDLSPVEWARDGADPARLGRVASHDAARLAR